MTMARGATRSPWQMSRTFSPRRSQAAAVDTKVEWPEILRSARQLESDADRPDFFPLDARRELRPLLNPSCYLLPRGKSSAGLSLSAEVPPLTGVAGRLERAHRNVLETFQPG
jgi:hypothetical protein